MADTPGQRVRDGVDTVLKCVAFIFLGVICQRLAIAADANAGQPSGSGGSVLPSPALPTGAGGNKLAQADPSLPPGQRGGKVAQAEDYGAPEVKESAPPEAPAQAPAQPEPSAEAISVETELSLKQRRRKPKMAGVPTGTQPVPEETPEAPSSTERVAGEAEKGGAPAAQQGSTPSQQPSSPEGPGKAAAGEAEGAEAPEEGGGGEAPGALAQEKVSREQQGLFARKYQLAPINWRGTVTETLSFRRYYSFSGVSTRVDPYAQSIQSYTPVYRIDTMQRMQTVMIQGTTYVIKPWLATIAGKVGVATGRQWGTEVAGTNLHGLIGAGSAQLFNQSRFPVTVDYSSTDSRTEMAANPNTTNGAADSDTIRKKLMVTNTYLSLDTITKGDASYVRDNLTLNMLEKQAFGPTVLTVNTGVNSNLTGSISTKLGALRDQPFTLKAAHSTYSGGTSYQTIAGPQGISLGEETNSLFASHVYAPEESLLTLRSTGSYFGTNIMGTQTTNWLLNSQATWQPEAEDVPLIVRGGGMVFDSSTESVGMLLNKNTGINANALLTYNAWRDRKLSGGGSLAITESNGTRTLTSTQFMRGDYVPGVKRFGASSYVQSYYAGFNRQTTTGATSDLNVYGTATHSFVAPYKFSLYGYNSTLKTSISQVLAAQHDSIYGPTEALTTTANLLWSPSLRRKWLVDREKIGEVREAANANAGAHLSIQVLANDRRVYGYGAGHSDAISFRVHLTGLGGFKARAGGYGATGDITINSTFQQNGGERTNALARALWMWGTNYDYVYKKPRFLGIKGLDYGLILRASGNTNLSAQRSEAIAAGAGRAGASNSGYGLSYGYSVTSALRYRLGQNEAMLKGDIKESFGVRSASLMMLFRAWRNFGN